MQQAEKIKAQMALAVSMRSAAVRPTAEHALNAVEKAVEEFGLDLDSPALTARDIATAIDFAATVGLDPAVLPTAA